jgi:hypothetical protein
LGLSPPVIFLDQWRSKISLNSPNSPEQKCVVYTLFFNFFFASFERAEWSTRAVIVLSDLYVHPLFYFRRLPETWLHNRKALAFSIFFNVRCSFVE